MEQAAFQGLHASDSQPAGTVQGQVVIFGCEGSIEAGEQQIIVEHAVERLDVRRELGSAQFGFAREYFVVRSHGSVIRSYDLNRITRGLLDLQQRLKTQPRGELRATRGTRAGDGAEGGVAEREIGHVEDGVVQQIVELSA